MSFVDAFGAWMCYGITFSVQEKEEIGKKVREERRKKKLQKDLGQTASGDK